MNILRSKWPFLYVLLVTGIIFAYLTEWSYDDVYITYRYAHNIASGLGFVYNAGERIQSTTTPFFALLLAGLSLIWDDIPKLANLIGAFSLALGAIFIWNLAQSWRTPVVGWVSLVIYPTFPLLLSTVSSETPIYLAFCLGSFAFYTQNKYNTTAVFAALATLTRPDGILVPALLAAHYLLRNKRPIPWKAITLFLLPTGLWFFFAWFYFGSPLPITLAVKRQHGTMDIVQGFAHRLIYIIANYYIVTWQYQLAAILSGIGILCAVLLYQQWLLILAWPLIYFLAYTLLGVSPNFWYFAPLVPGFVIAIGLGIAWIYHKWQVSITSGPYQRKANQLLSALPLLLIAPIVIRQYTNMSQIPNMLDKRIEIYRAVGDWLAINTPPEATVGVLEVGIIGYYAGRSMIDFAGLLQPLTSQQIESDTTWEDLAIWAIGYYQPEYLVLYSDWISSLEESYLNYHCQRLQSFPGDDYGFGKTLYIYACNP